MYLIIIQPNRNLPIFALPDVNARLDSHFNTRPLVPVLFNVTSRNKALSLINPAYVVQWMKRTTDGPVVSVLAEPSLGQ
jgi:hypothetical protein